MPASLPGSSAADNLVNPTDGIAVAFDLLSGPKGSPLDNDSSDNASTGGLSTGIGCGTNHVFGIGQLEPNFDADYIPGITKPDGTQSLNSTMMYIGGGKSTSDGTSQPYSAGFGIGSAGDGGSRDAGAGPAFTGFVMTIATATGAVANGGEVDTGLINRSGELLNSGQSVFGSSDAASATPA
jgi:hypothetical protein